MENKFENYEYIDTDFNPAQYNTDELESIRHKISEEIHDRKRSQEDIDLIELKTKYENKWVRVNNSEREIFYITNIETSYSIYVIKLSRDGANNIFNLITTLKKKQYLIGEEHYVCNYFFDNLEIMELDEVNDWIEKFKTEIVDYISGVFKLC